MLRNPSEIRPKHSLYHSKILVIGSEILRCSGQVSSTYQNLSVKK